MNRHKLFNNGSAGVMTGSKRISTLSNNDNNMTSSLLDSDILNIRRSTGVSGMAMMTRNSDTLGMNQLSTQMKNLNDRSATLDETINQISEITPDMYLCGARALKASRIRALGITTIINVTVEIPNVQLDKVEFIKIAIEDCPSSNLSIYFDEIADKIDQVVRRGGKVLVHCMAGISRSASLCIAYLMKYKRMSLRQAYRRAKAQRPIVHPNPGFFRQLIDYEMKLFGSTTMSIVYNNSTARTQLPQMFEQKPDRLSSPVCQNKYKTYNNISRPLELPTRSYQKYGRQ